MYSYMSMYSDMTVRLWDAFAVSEQCRTVFEHHSEFVVGLDEARNIFASTGWDRRLVIWAPHSTAASTRPAGTISKRSGISSSV